METTIEIIEININTKSEFRICVQIRKISMVLGLPDPGSGILKVTEDFSMDLHPHPDPHLDQLVRGTDPRIRIRTRTKMSRIRITAQNNG
jgi:hypothetical protein